MTAEHRDEIASRLVLTGLLDHVSVLTALLQEGVDNGYFDDESTCPYYTQTGDKTCDRGCYDEPGCHTNHPREGWLGERVRAVLTQIDTNTESREQ